MQKIKNFLLVSFSLFFGLSIVAFSAFQVGKAEVRAEGEDEFKMELIDLGREAKESSESQQREISPREMKQLEIAGEEPKGINQKVDYYLAYPGILPDHPLYWLKMLRDKVALFLTKKPLARLERLLLYADKRIGAAGALIEGNKVELGLTTADKAEKYLEQAVGEFEGLAKAGEAQPELRDRLEKALLKHQEVLVNLLDKVPDQSRAILDQALEKSEQNYQKIKNQFD
jgi:hypothetical protein